MSIIKRWSPDIDPEQKEIPLFKMVFSIGGEGENQNVSDPWLELRPEYEELRSSLKLLLENVKTPMEVRL